MNLKIPYCFIALFMLAACNNDTDELPVEIPISMNAQMVTDVDATRALSTNEIRGALPSKEYPLEALLCFSTTSKVYDAEPTPVVPTYLPCHTTINYTSGTKTYPAPIGENDIKYPIDNTKVYCIGLHPNTGWTFEDDNPSCCASYTLDGRSDIMFAPEINGSMYTPFGTQTYTHLQTWVKLNVCATYPEAIEAWGKIKSIKLKGYNNIKIDLDTEFNNRTELKTALSTGKIAFGGELTLEPVVESDDVYLKTQLKELSSFFYVPAGINNNVLEIETKNKGKITVSFDLVDENHNVITDLSDALGKIFVIELHFFPIDMVKVKCTLNQWEDWTDNLYMEKN